MALTVCFHSIVYEDALTILSYASPYPVILRVQRPSPTARVSVTKEKTSSTNKVKWRDDFEHYDNESKYERRSLVPFFTVLRDSSVRSFVRVTPASLFLQLYLTVQWRKPVRQSRFRRIPDRFYRRVISIFLRRSRRRRRERERKRRTAISRRRRRKPIE